MLKAHGKSFSMDEIQKVGMDSQKNDLHKIIKRDEKR